MEFKTFKAPQEMISPIDAISRCQRNPFWFAAEDGSGDMAVIEVYATAGEWQSIMFDRGNGQGPIKRGWLCRGYGRKATSAVVGREIEWGDWVQARMCFVENEPGITLEISLE